MRKIKNVLKFKLLPKRTYLAISANKKYKRAVKKGEIELHLLPFLVNPNKISIDIGANTGLYTHFLSKISREVYAFEPHKILAGFLEKAAASNVRVINCGVSDSCGIKTFYTPLINGEKSLNIASIEKENVAEFEYVEDTLETKTIDHFNLKDVGFVKIDVEGHEMEVLNGAEKTIKACHPIMLIEILDAPQSLDIHPVIQLMQTYKYQVFDLQDNILRIINLKQPYTGTNRNFLFLPQS